ncbi:hypothetical protein LIER_17800 [Lithospermum erythrorhizon]|uniref:SWIM-type domain-containing protein n=1 Tax=Lithospermum erythrorhizon TaxID=34254 RepID=A0AAV3QE48_LITER
MEDPKVGIQQNAYEWLSSIPPEKWSRSHFPIHSKCDAVTNNMCESFNNYILEARELPIISMLESIKGKLITRIQVKRAGMLRCEGKICPNIKKKVAKTALFSKGWDCQFAREERYEISNGTYKHCVRLDKRECSCGMFQLSGIPCCHAMCCIIKYRKNEDDYVHAFYTKETYLKIYEHMIHLIPGKNDYVESEIEAVLPPQSKAKVGRPQKSNERKRARSQSLASSTTGQLHESPSEQ